MRNGAPTSVDLAVRIYAYHMVKSANPLAAMGKFLGGYVAPKFMNFAKNRVPAYWNKAVQGAQTVWQGGASAPAQAAAQKAKSLTDTWQTGRAALQPVYDQTSRWIRAPYAFGRLAGQFFNPLYAGAGAMGMWAGRSAVMGAAQGTEQAKADIRQQAAGQVGDYMQQHIFGDPSMRWKMGLGLMFNPDAVQQQMQQALQRYGAPGGGMPAAGPLGKPFSPLAS